MGKGSGRRNEDVKKIWDNWDNIFKKDKQEEPKPQEEKPQQPSKENAK